MPTYEYECRKCGHRFELFHSIKDDKPKRCPRCKGRAVRVPSAGAGIVFKGSGFYITDHRSSDYQKKANAEKGEASGGSSKEASESKTPKETKDAKPAAAKPAKSKSPGGKSRSGGASD
jgi:putative FmdB family regulatory protein